MHESSLIPDLIGKIKELAAENDAARVVSVDVTVGALTGMSPDHLREHFDEAAEGTVAEGAEVRCRVSDDPLSAAVVLESLEMEQ